MRGRSEERTLWEEEDSVEVVERGEAAAAAGRRCFSVEPQPSRRPN